MERADPEPDPDRAFFVYDKHTDRIEPLRDYAARLLEAGGKEPPTTWEGLQAEYAALTRLNATARNGEMLDADDLKQVPDFKLSEFANDKVTVESISNITPPHDFYEEHDYLLRVNIEEDHAASQKPEEKRYTGLKDYLDDIRPLYSLDDDHER